MGWVTFSPGCMISKFMYWNGFPANVQFSIIRKLKAKDEIDSCADCNKHDFNEMPSQNYSSDDTRPKIWLRIPFMRNEGEFLVKKLFTVLFPQNCNIAVSIAMFMR